jgi:hypothetical protein
MKSWPDEAAARYRRTAIGQGAEHFGIRGDPAKGIAYPRDGENHEVIPYHDPIKTGTLASILKRIAAHHRMSVDDLLTMLDL